MPFLAFIDNEAAKFALTRGSTKDTPVNALLCIYLTAVARVGSFPWFTRVSTQANAADAISRFDEAFARKMHWRRLNFECLPIYEELLSFIQSGELSAANVLCRLDRIIEDEWSRSVDTQ